MAQEQLASSPTIEETLSVDDDPFAELVDFEARAKTLETLEALVGDRVFYYGGRSGTVTVMAAVCPAFGLKLEEGVDASLAWMEANDQPPVQNPEEEAEDESEKEMTSSDESQEPTIKPETKPTVDQKNEKVAVTEARRDDGVVEPASESETQTTSGGSDAETPTVQPRATQEQQPTTAITDTEETPLTSDELHHTDMSHASLSVEIDSTLQKVDTMNAPTEQIAEAGDVNTQVGTTEIPIDIEAVETASETVVAMPGSDTQESIETAALDETTERIGPDVNRQINDEEVMDDARPFESAPQSAVVEQFVESMLAKELSSLKDVVENTAFGEEDHTAISDELEVTTEASDTLDESFGVVEAPEPSRQDEVAVEYFEVAHLDELPEPLRQDLDVLLAHMVPAPLRELPAVATTELQRKVADVTTSIEVLEGATDAETCREVLDVLRQELEELLNLLGYEGANELALQLTRRYDTATLKKYMIALMQFFLSARTSTTTSRVSRAHVRHHHYGATVVRLVVNLVGSDKSAYYQSAAA